MSSSVNRTSSFGSGSSKVAGVLKSTMLHLKSTLRQPMRVYTRSLKKNDAAGTKSGVAVETRTAVNVELKEAGIPYKVAAQDTGDDVSAVRALDLSLAAHRAYRRDVGAAAAELDMQVKAMCELCSQQDAEIAKLQNALQTCEKDLANEKALHLRTTAALTSKLEAANAQLVAAKEKLTDEEVKRQQAEARLQTAIKNESALASAIISTERQHRAQQARESWTAAKANSIKDGSGKGRPTCVAVTGALSELRSSVSGTSPTELGSAAAQERRSCSLDKHIDDRPFSSAEQERRATGVPTEAPWSGTDSTAANAPRQSRFQAFINKLVCA